METYKQIKARHQKDLDAFPLGAAFSNSQLEEMMKKFGLPNDKTGYAQIVSLERAYKCLLPAFALSQMQHPGCAYRLGVVCVDTKRYEEGLRYLDLATQLMLPDTTIMKAITLSRGEGYYLTEHYAEAVAAWKEHLTYNPKSIATYYNIANTYALLLEDKEQAKPYYQQFLDLARKEENPTTALQEMMQKAEAMLSVP